MEGRDVLSNLGIMHMPSLILLNREYWPQYIEEFGVCVRAYMNPSCCFPMGGCGSKQKIERDAQTGMLAKARQTSARVVKDNVEVDNGAVYSGEFMSGLKDGEGTQKCMYMIICIS